MLDLLGKKITALFAHTKQKTADLHVLVQNGVTGNQTHEQMFREKLYELRCSLPGISGPPIEALDDEGLSLIGKMGPNKAWLMYLDVYTRRTGGAAAGAVGDHSIFRFVISYSSDGAGVITSSGSTVNPWLIAIGPLPGFLPIFDDAGGAYPRFRFTDMTNIELDIVTRIQVLEV